MNRYDNNSFGYFKNGDLTFLHRTGDKDYMPEEFINSDLFKLIDSNLLEFPVSFGFEIRINEDGLLWAMFYLIGQEHTFFGSSQLNIPNSVGSIEFFVNTEEVSISWVEVKDDYRGKGLAKYLLLLSLSYGKKMFPSMNKVILDDDSGQSAAGTMTDEERSNALQRNIYYKLGFRYIDIEDGPEMEGNVDVILSENEKSFIESKRKRKVEFDEMAQSKKRRRRGGGKYSHIGRRGENAGYNRTEHRREDGSSQASGISCSYGESRIAFACQARNKISCLQFNLG